MSYYHTHRPQQFSDLVGQEHIATILQEALRTDRLAHAYLFCGTRGTGKTTTARLLAKAVNCPQAKKDEKNASSLEPCNDCQLCKDIAAGNCLDVVEIDAASNRGIDEVRQLQEQIRFRPQLAKKKIVIIDEVHMLTKEAFNALLKTLEEPPAYLLFILATTEPHKLPATIISRCQRFDFRTPTVSVIQRYLERLATAEKLEIDQSALERIAQLANGSFRDSTTLLEQIGHATGPITAESVTERLGLPELSLVDRYLTILAGQADDSLPTDLQQYFQRGGNAVAFVDLAFRRLADSMESDLGLAGKRGLVLQTLVRVKYQLKVSPIAELPILVSATDTQPVQLVVAAPSSQATQRTTSSIKVAPQPAVALATAPAKTVTKEPALDKVSDNNSAAATSAAPVMAETVVIAAEPAPSTDTVTVSVAEQVPPAAPPSGDVGEVWQTLLSRLIANGESSMVAMLRTAKPLSWEPPVFQIAVQFSFHADQLGRTKNRGILEPLLSELFGAPVRIELVLQPATDLAAAVEEISI